MIRTDGEGELRDRKTADGVGNRPMLWEAYVYDSATALLRVGRRESSALLFQFGHGVFTGGII